ncbi:MAG: YihY/virulence factor BrkB family protein [Nocardioidaceae bacterium]|nr:YihY/virulence factor BrkB family protein [Nocardioidaceae bacterium]
MTTATEVPVTTDMDGDELNAEDAWNTVRHHGLRALAVESFLRFRFGDGFTNSRALALQMALSLVPFLLALTGLAADIDDGRTGEVITATVSALTPGSGGGEVIGQALPSGEPGDEAGEIALGFGLAFALIAMTTAMAQVERGANRLYGIRRDRPALRKYGRAAVMTAALAVPVGLGFLLLVAGGPLGDAMAQTYGWSTSQERWWDVLRWPIGLVSTTFTVAVLLDHSPRRRQPALSWLALGAAVAVVLTMLASGLLALYVHYSGSFGSVYGPLAGVMALLLWCYLSAGALFAGTAVAAQLEALRAGLTEPVLPDPGPTLEVQRIPDGRTVVDQRGLRRGL